MIRDELESIAARAAGVVVVVGMLVLASFAAYWIGSALGIWA